MKLVPLEVSMMKRIGELKAENARLKAEVERLTDCKAGADRLKAEVERLTKAGDAMADVITEFRCGPRGNHVKNAFVVWNAWLAAKEGKPSV